MRNLQSEMETVQQLLDAFHAKHQELVSIGHDEPKLLHEATHILPWTAVVVYLIMVFYLPTFLTSIGFKGRKMKPLMVIWNLGLSAISLAMFLGAGVPYIKSMIYDGLEEAICDEKSKLFSGRTTFLFWAWTFTLSKYAELLDTLFLIIKNPERKVAFLHWFHHATVLLFTWYAAYYKLSAGGSFIAMNSIIHTFMYYYYFKKELGYNPWWALPLTIGQISQMFLGIFFNGTWAYKYLVEKKKCTCDNPDVIIISCGLMYGAYLFLFCRFFVRRYILGTAPGSGKKPASTTKSDNKKSQ